MRVGLCGLAVLAAFVGLVALCLFVERAPLHLDRRHRRQLGGGEVGRHAIVALVDCVHLLLFRRGLGLLELGDLAVDVVGIPLVKILVRVLALPRLQLRGGRRLGRRLGSAGATKRDRLGRFLSSGFLLGGQRGDFVIVPNCGIVGHLGSRLGSRLGSSRSLLGLDRLDLHNTRSTPHGNGLLVGRHLGTRLGSLQEGIARRDVREECVKTNVVGHGFFIDALA